MPLTKSVAIAPDVAHAGQSLLQECGEPVAIPDKDLTEREAAGLWAQDRLALDDCGARHAALAQTVTVIEGRGRKGAGQ